MKNLPTIYFFSLLGIFCLPSQRVWSQDSLLVGFERMEWEAAYFGELATHPGLKLGINYPFGHRLKIKEKNKAYRSPYHILKKKQWVLGTNLLFYHQAQNHTGYLVNLEMGRRRIKNKTKRASRYTLWGIDLGLGYYRYLLSGTTFHANQNGFESSRGQGSALMPSLSFSWGRSLRSAKPQPGFLYVKLSSLYEIPFGIGFQMRLGLESGVIYPLSQPHSTSSKPR